MQFRLASTSQSSCFGLSSAGIQLCNIRDECGQMLSGPSVLRRLQQATLLHMRSGFTPPIYLPGAVVPSISQGIAQMTSFQLWGNPGENSELSADQSCWSQGVQSQPAVW